MNSMRPQPRYVKVREYLKDFLINRGQNLTPIRTIIGLIQNEFEISEKQATNYVNSFIDVFCQPPDTREYEYYVPNVRGMDWGMKQGYLRWKGKKDVQ